MDISTLNPGDTVNVRYASSSVHGGTYADTVTVDRVQGDLVFATNGYRYHRDTVLSIKARWAECPHMTESGCEKCGGLCWRYKKQTLRRIL